MPKTSISVVIPMYNSEQTIVASLDSVLSQTYDGYLEVIVVNDGSIDSSQHIVERYASDNASQRVTIRLINKTNGGVSSARNLGIKEASHDWIALLDSDDVWFPEKLSAQIDIIKKYPGIKFLGTNWDGGTYPFLGRKSKKVFALGVKALIFKWYPSGSTALIKKDVLIQAGLYDETRTHAEDGDLWLRIAQYGNLWVLNQDLVFTGGGKRSFGESGLSANLSKMHKGEMLAVEAAFRRKQVSFMTCVFLIFWLKIKYLRRILVVRMA